MDDIDTKLIAILKEKSLGFQVDEVKTYCNLRTELGLNSLRLTEVLITIEEVFNITFSESDLDPNEIITVGDLLSIIKKSNIA